MSAPYEVLHVTTGMGQGGAETALARLVAHSDSSIVRHHLLALSSEGPQWDSTSRACTSALNLLLDRPHVALPRVLQVARFMRASRPDLIQGWMYHGSLAARWLQERYAKSVPLIFGIRQSLYEVRRERPLTRVVIRAVARHSRDAIVVYNSEVSRRQHAALGYCDDRSFVIPNGFDSAKFVPDTTVRRKTRAALGLRDSEFVVGLIGRFHPVKDHITFVRAASVLARELPGAHFLIVGPGCTPKNRVLSEIIRLHGESARFSLLGDWRDMETLYPALDALCLTSLSEGFPNVVGEAMCCGVISVCSRVGDIPRLVDDAGYLVPAGDHLSVASHLLQIARFDPKFRAAVSSAARQRIIAHFSIEDMIQKYMKLYTHAINGPLAISRAQP